MQPKFTMIDLQTLLYFPVKDKESRYRLLIASAVGFLGFIIPVLPWLLMLGYAGAITKQVIIEGREPQMPGWQNWSEYLTPGLKLFGVHFIYSIPVIVPLVLGYLIMMLPAFTGIFLDPYNSDPDRMTGLFMLGSMGGMALFGLGMLFSLALWIILPPALCHAAVKDSFSAGFQFREWWKIWRANIGGFVIALIISGGLYMAMMLVMQVIYMTLILCIILPFFMAMVSAYLTIVVFTLFAQAYREGLKRSEMMSIASKPVSPLSSLPAG